MQDSQHNALPEKSSQGPPPPGEGLTASRSMRQGLKIVGIQFCALVVISTIFAVFDLDRAISSLFYRPDAKWFMGRDAVWVFFYKYGTIPGALVTLGCLIAWLVTFFNRRGFRWRPYFLLVVLTTAIAGGILVNSVLKSYWGRPRPNQTTEFGGFYTYRHVFPPGTPGKGASFPCGHCTMGFTLLSLYFVKRRSRILAYSGVATGLLLGILLSAARIINGAHFMTDAIWSLGIVSMTAVALYYCVLKIPVRRPATDRPALTLRRKIALIVSVGIAAAVLVGAFMTRRPFYKTTEYYPPVAADITHLEIELNVDTEKLVVNFRDNVKPTVLIHAHGFGWANADYEIKNVYDLDDFRMVMNIRIDERSYFAELDHTVEVVLPEDMRNRMTVLVNPR